MGDLKERLDKKKRNIKKAKQSNIELVQKDVMFKKKEVGNEENKPAMKNKGKREKENNVDTSKPLHVSKDKLVKAEQEMKKKKSQKKKRKSEEKNNALVGKFDQLSAEAEDGFDDKNEDKLVKGEQEMKRKKSQKKKRKSEEKNNASVGKFDRLGAEAEDGFDDKNDDEAGDPSLFKAERDVKSAKALSEADAGTEIETGKFKKPKPKKKKKDHGMTKAGASLLDKREEADQDDFYCISSGDEDCSKGMKKWLTEYHQNRPGLKVLQQSIDEFITAHEEKLEQERKEREARDAEGGWTVVVHHKGRKKTTDAESGVTVGSTHKTIMEDQMTKKKHKEVGLNFYRFQRREAQRNEILSLQSKFEQEKKRIHQLRAARKFRPY